MLEESISKNKQEYLENIDNWSNIPLFFQPWYLDALVQNGGHDKYWAVCLSKSKEGKIQGALPYFVSSKYGLSHITMPILTPYLGPWIIYPGEELKTSSIYSYEKKVLQDLIDGIPKVFLAKMHTHVQLKNILPFIWNGYEAHVRYTFCLKKKAQTQLWMNLDSKQRNIIKNAKEKFTFHHSENISAFYNLNKISFERSGNNIPYSYSLMSKLDEALKNHSSRTILFAKDSNNNIHAGIYLVNDKRSSYCLAIGNDTKFKNSGALPWLVWMSILKSFEYNEVYNFEGGMIPNIEQFFRSFGGEMVPYFGLQKARSKVMKALLILFNKL